MKIKKNLLIFFQIIKFLTNGMISKRNLILLNYILPTEDLEDLNLIKNKL